MRELKFRIWDGIEKKYIYRLRDLPETLDWDYLTNTWTNEKGLTDKICQKLAKKLVLEQYTGLKDKSGREIYEGDIIKLADGAVGEVKFNNGSFYHTAITKIIGQLYWNEIIGNIHENPELINATL